LVQDLTPAAPRQKVLDLGLFARSAGLWQEVIGYRNADSHRFQGGALAVDFADQQLPDRRRFAKNAGNCADRFLNLNVAAGLSPRIDED
jgi:hypothetical protein